MSWRAKRNCGPETAHLFFPTNAAGGHNDEAFRLCAECPVRAECRAEGRELRAHGIWGGENQTERTDAGAGPADGRHSDRYREGFGPTDSRESVKAGQVVRAQKLRAAGVEITEIAKMLGVSRRQVHRFFSDE